LTQKLGRIWKNEYFKTAITLALMILVVFGFFQALKTVLKTEYAMLAVVSTSMLPTLNVGDLIIVQGASASEVNASYGTGDIVVFKDSSDPNFRIVHRAVKKEVIDGHYIIKTHGDNNSPGEETVEESQLIGKVIARIPYVGNLSLLTQSQGNMYLFLLIAIILIVILMIFWNTGSDNETSNGKQKQGRKLFGKLPYSILHIAVINALLVSFVVFNLWGAFTFWQPGAVPAQYVTARGMSVDLQYHASFKGSYNNISTTFLSQGLFTYKIDSTANGIPRSGVLTFSWLQFSILLLIVYDAWESFNFVRSYRSARTETPLDYSEQPSELQSD